MVVVMRTEKKPVGRNLAASKESRITDLSNVKLLCAIRTVRIAKTGTGVLIPLISPADQCCGWLRGLVDERPESEGMQLL